MQSVNNASTPSPAFNVAGPNKRTIAEGAWNVGTVNAIDAHQLQITGGTLEFITGPTVNVVDVASSAGSPLVLNANTAVPQFDFDTGFIYVGKDGGNPAAFVHGFGGVPQWRTRRTNGTEAAPSAILSGNNLGQFQFAGAVDNSGTLFSQSVGFQTEAIENFTTAAQGSKMVFNLVEQGTTNQVFPLTLTGATGQKGVQINGGLSIDQAGTFIANSTTAVTVAATGVTAASVILTSVHTPGGTVTYPPHVLAISAGTNFTIVAASLDTSTYNYAIIN